MTPVSTFSGSRVALFGLGGSGLATAQALQAGGATVIACDDDAAKMEKAAALGIGIGDLKALDWLGIAALILSPGVPFTHKDGQPFTHWTVALARAAGVEVIGDIELFCRERKARAPQAPFVAITGTNGKSTTTALIAHILTKAGRDVQLGGNIGTAILSLELPSAQRVHVVECSTFQIDLAPSLSLSGSAPSVGVQLNLTPDHLDRHGSMDAYGAIKERLVAASDVAVIGIDDEWSAAMAERRARAGRPLERISVKNLPDHGYALGLEGSKTAPESMVLRLRGGVAETVAPLTGVRSLRGAHNAQNACAAFAACSALGVDDATIAAALRDFPGLAHRMEEVARIGRVSFINDSKATNADSTDKALSAFPGGLYWIVGGTMKEGGITPLERHFHKIVKAYLIGASSDAFAATLEGKVAYERSGTLDRAVKQAAADAAASEAEEPVVLLSPACASYDQFANFEQRGDRFKALVAALPL